MKNLVFTDFKLGNRTLSSFGGAIYNNGNVGQANLLPSISIQTEENTGVDGAIPYSSKIEPRTIELSVVFQVDNFDREGFNNWLNFKEPQWFNFIGDNRKIKVMRQDTVDMEVYNEKQSTCELSFIAYDPYWRLIEETPFSLYTPVQGRVYSFYTFGNVESYPLIGINGSATSQFSFTLNYKTYTIENFSGNLYIDCETETVYTKLSNGNKINKIADFNRTAPIESRFNFPTLNAGENLFRINTILGVTGISIDKNSRIL